MPGSPTSQASSAPSDVEMGKMDTVAPAAPGQVLMEGSHQAAPEQDIFGSQIKIKQKFNAMQALEALTGLEAKNSYEVTGSPAGPMYISENSGCLERLCCGPNRSAQFNLHVGSTKDDPVVMKFKKDFHCQQCDCPGVCRPKLAVLDVNDQQIGRVEDPCACFALNQQIFETTNGNEEQIFYASGACCQAGIFCPCCFPVKFPYHGKGKMEGKEDGMVIKKPMGLMELCCDTQSFDVVFPEGTTVNQKGILVGSAMLIDFRYFEKQKEG